MKAMTLTEETIQSYREVNWADPGVADLLLEMVRAQKPYFLRILNNRNDLDDLISEVYCRIFVHVGNPANRSKKIENIGAYIRKVGLRVIIDGARKHDPKRHTNLDDLTAAGKELSDNGTGSREVENKILRDELRQAICLRLKGESDYQTSLLIMSLWEDRSNEEISDLLNEDFEKIQHDVFLAKANLRHHLRSLIKER